DLNKMDVIGILDASVRHGLPDGLSRHINLPLPADVRRRELWCKCDTDDQRLLFACRSRIWIDRENDIVRRQHSLHAAREDEWNPFSYVLGRDAHPSTDKLGQAERQVATRIVVNKPISVRLADDRNDLCRIDDAFIDGLAQTRNITRIL